MMYCSWCRGNLHGYYLRYDNRIFCRREQDKCLKEYLFDKFDEEITEGYIDNSEVEYDMGEVE